MRRPACSRSAARRGPTPLRNCSGVASRSLVRLRRSPLIARLWLDRARPGSRGCAPAARNGSSRPMPAGFSARARVVADDFLQQRSSGSGTPPTLADSSSNRPTPLLGLQHAGRRHRQAARSGSSSDRAGWSASSACAPRRDRRRRGRDRRPAPRIVDRRIDDAGRNLIARVEDEIRVHFVLGDGRAARLLRGFLRLRVDRRDLLLQRAASRLVVLTPASKPAGGGSATAAARTAEVSEPMRHITPVYRVDRSAPRRRPRLQRKLTRPNISCSTSAAWAARRATPAPGSSARRQRWRSAARPRCRRPASPGSRRRRRRERRRRRRCCRRSRPETAACGFRARCTRPGCRARPSVTQTSDAPKSRPMTSSARPRSSWPVSAAGNSSAAMIASMFCSRSAMPGPDFLDVDDRRDARVARIPRRPRRRGRLMAVDDQQAPRRDRVPRGTSAAAMFSAGMPIPEDRSLARSRIDEDHGKLVGRAGDRTRGADVHAQRRQAVPRQRAEVVVSEAADVARAPPQRRAGRHRGRRSGRRATGRSAEAAAWC